MARLTSVTKIFLTETFKTPNNEKQVSDEMIEWQICNVQCWGDMYKYLSQWNKSRFAFSVLLFFPDCSKVTRVIPKG